MQIEYILNRKKSINKNIKQTAEKLNIIDYYCSSGDLSTQYQYIYEIPYIGSTCDRCNMSSTAFKNKHYRPLRKLVLKWMTADFCIFTAHLVVVVLARVHREVIWRVGRAGALPRPVVEGVQRGRGQRLEGVNRSRNGGFQRVGVGRRHHADAFAEIRRATSSNQSIERN